MHIPNREEISVARLHPVQFSMWEELALLIGAIEIQPDEIPMFGTAPIKFQGIRIEKRADFAKDVIQFHDAAENVLSEIYCLAVPVEMQC